MNISNAIRTTYIGILWILIALSTWNNEWDKGSFFALLLLVDK